MISTTRQRFEPASNLSYLTAVWALATAMRRRRDHVAPEQRPEADRLREAFTSLAAGDTAHLALRSVSTARGEGRGSGVRLVMLAAPFNRRDRDETPAGWGVDRNLPLIAAGVGEVHLMRRAAERTGDRTFRWTADSMAASFACYTPVVATRDTRARFTGQNLTDRPRRHSNYPPKVSWCRSPLRTFTTSPSTFAFVAICGSDGPRWPLTETVQCTVLI